MGSKDEKPAGGAELSVTAEGGAKLKVDSFASVSTLGRGIFESVLPKAALRAKITAAYGDRVATMIRRGEHLGDDERGLIAAVFHREFENLRRRAQIVEEAEERLGRLSLPAPSPKEAQPPRSADPDVVEAILEEGSKTSDDTARGLFSQLLAQEVTRPGFRV